MNSDDERYVLAVLHDGDVRLSDQLNTERRRAYRGPKALYDALGDLALWREADAFNPRDKAGYGVTTSGGDSGEPHLPGRAAATPSGVPPCTCNQPSGLSGCEQHMPVKLTQKYRDEHNVHYVRIEGGKRQFCVHCKGTVTSYRTFLFGAGRVHVGDCCWSASSWNAGRRR